MNISNKIFLNKKFLIYGMGKTGLSSFNFLKRKNQIFLYDGDSKLLNLQFKENLVYLVLLTTLQCKITGEKTNISP